jgi:hypothetical protein
MGIEHVYVVYDPTRPFNHSESDGDWYGTECLKREFKDWLEGKHDDNLNPHIHRNTTGGAVRRDMHGQEVVNWVPTWWVPNQLTYLLVRLEIIHSGNSEHSQMAIFVKPRPCRRLRRSWCWWCCKRAATQDMFKLRDGPLDWYFCDSEHVQLASKPCLDDFVADLMRCARHDGDPRLAR